MNTKPHYQAVKIADPFYVDNSFSQPTKLANNWLVIPVNIAKPKSKVQTQPSPKSKKKGKGEFGLWAVSKISWATATTTTPNSTKKSRWTAGRRT